jgi:hypothetical protein
MGSTTASSLLGLELNQLRLLALARRRSSMVVRR